MISIGYLICFLIILTAILIAILSRPLNLNKNLYMKLFFVLFLLTSFSSLLSFFIPVTIFGVVASLSLFFTFGFVLLHSSEVLGNKKTAIFFIIAFSFGLFWEAESIKYGLLFGGSHYYYNIPTFFFGSVPLTIPISWVIIIYISYILSNLLLFGFGGEKPRKTDNLWYFIGLITLISSISGLIAVNLDMMFDPVAVSPQLAEWVWIGGGPYFGIPIGNFIQWFLLTAIAILIFRCYEAISSRIDTYPVSNTYSYLYILIIYIMYFLTNAVTAFRIGKIEYILIGATTIGPFILIGILALILNIKKR
jgi:uncharacterized membrane protein